MLWCLKRSGRLVSLLVTEKMVVLRAVTVRVWAEFAVWRTRASTLKGWKLKGTKQGCRLITPLIGAAMEVYVGKAV